MKNNYFYSLLLLTLIISTLASTSSVALALLPEAIADSLKTKEVVILEDTRANKPKGNSLIVFKPFAPYATNLRVSNKENVKVLNNVRVYPNPVSDQINLTYKLTKDMNVSIKIMDALGNEINTLLSQRLEAGDQVHNFPINTKLSSGFYFIRIMAGTETVVKRIQIL